MSKPARVQPVFTNLGMHFVQAGSEVVLVQVEVNVRGLLSLHARRLIKSRRGMATVSSQTVRMTIATPEGQETAAAARDVVEKCEGYDRMHAEHASMARQNIALFEQVGFLNRKLSDRQCALEREGSGI